MKKINFKQAKYILPLILLLPLLGLLYSVSNMFASTNEEQNGVATDSINTSLPEADPHQLEGKMDEMDRATWSDERYTAVNGLGLDEEEKDEASHGYSEAELDAIDKINAERAREAKEKAELERSLQESRRHVNSYTNHGSSGRSSTARSQYDEMEEYANALEEIQNRNRRRNNYGSMDDVYSSETNNQSSNPSKVKEEPKVTPAEIVYKTPIQGADKFHTISNNHKSVDEALIKAIIDKTTKARSGTRLRFKLLDDVTIKGISIKKGTYLYGTVTGFGSQRVTASITSILVKDKFIKVNLSVYDNDGMEGFYVPESQFRAFVKDASSNVVSNGMTINNNSPSSGISGEIMALQALQNLYSSATSAVSNNIRQDKAKIKYNTIVYLINSSQTEEQ